jgi:hypothetical protein
MIVMPGMLPAGVPANKYALWPGCPAAGYPAAGYPAAGRGSAPAPLPHPQPHPQRRRARQTADSHDHEDFTPIFSGKSLRDHEITFLFE